MKISVRRKIWLAVLLLAVIGGVATALLWQNGKPPFLYTADNLLDGFIPGTQVTYKIFPDKGEAVSGQGEIDAEGRLRLPPYLATDGAPPPARLTYDFLIEEPAQQEPLSITMTLNNQTGDITLLCGGLDTFADMSIENGDEKITLKADWAGAVRSMDDLQMTAIKPGAPVQLAFLSQNVGSDVVDTRPKIIQVLWAPGGGGPTSAGVNQFDPLRFARCAAPEEYSFCPPSHINDFTRQTRSLTEWSIVASYVQALKLMTEQFSAVMMQQAQIIGSFLDAQNQMQAQRDMRRLTAQAHKDYHPGETMCHFGSFIKDVSQAEQKAAFEKQGLNDILMTAYAGPANSVTAEGYATDIHSRLQQFKTTYCDPQDNNNGLSQLCGEGGGAPERLNSDIDFSRTADYPLTLDINFSDDRKTKAEEDVIALARHIYWPQAMEPAFQNEIADKPAVYAKARNLMAVQNVAHNSFAHMIGMKSRTTSGLGAQSGWAYMKAYLKEFGLTPAEIDKMLGQHPSYYAQMEVLTKKIYQNPGFYTNLYDKPVNVGRIGVSMDAIGLMQDRDQYELALRKEMLLALLLEQELKKKAAKVESSIRSTTGD